MGKQSRRTRTYQPKQTTAPQRTIIESSRPRPTIDITLDSQNPDDKPVIDVFKSSKNYATLRYDDIGTRPSRIGCPKQYFKYMCRSIRKDQAHYIVEIVEELINFHLYIKAGLTEKKPLDLYYHNYNAKVYLIQFLTHAHNGNTPKANKYYLKWREMMSNRMDSLLFTDCSDEYVEVDGKRIDCDKDEAVRLLAEQIQKDIDFYTLMWPILLGTTIPSC